MTYWSSTSRISRGLGRWLRPDCAFSSSSSRMMSLQSSTHSSQMNTLGPAMSLRTSCWLFPQNEQYRILLLSPERPWRSSVMRLLPWWKGSVSRISQAGQAPRRGRNDRPKRDFRRDRRDADAGSTRLDRLVGTTIEHGIDHAVRLRRVRVHEVVAVGVLGDALHRLAGVLRQDRVEPV